MRESKRERKREEKRLLPFFFETLKRIGRKTRKWWKSVLIPFLIPLTIKYKATIHKQTLCNKTVFAIVIYFRTQRYHRQFSFLVSSFFDLVRPITKKKNFSHYTFAGESDMKALFYGRFSQEIIKWDLTEYNSFIHRYQESKWRTESLVTANICSRCPDRRNDVGKWNAKARITYVSR